MTATGKGALQVVAYEPGVCNIGPAEIAARRRVGHIGLVAAAIALAILWSVQAPAWTRLLVGLPAAAAAVGYLQAALHFCAGFGSKGVFNFGPLGTVQTIANDAARAADRRRSIEIFLAGAAIGLVVGVVLALLPIA